MAADQLIKLSSFLRENPETKLTDREIDQILEMRLPSVPERAEKLFRYLANQLPGPGDSLRVSMTDVRDVIERAGKDSAMLDPNGSIYKAAQEILPLLAACWSQEHTSLNFYLNNYLGSTRGLIERSESNAYKISGRGWEYLSANKLGESDCGFVAMSFATELEETYRLGIEKAILLAGYRPVRIDKHPHINRIDDEIIAQLRRSKFVVADFTQQRNGVYFEAGFGLGLGLPVFWTCRADDLKNVHFDARQYNAIKWEPTALAEFASSLANRIVALLGQGNFKG